MKFLEKKAKGPLKVSGKQCGILITSFLFHVTVLENSILITNKYTVCASVIGSLYRSIIYTENVESTAD